LRQFSTNGGAMREVHPAGGVARHRTCLYDHPSMTIGSENG
jgi:hypothetical protein